MTISRRDFLVGGGALAATAALGCATDKESSETYDLCIIGSGFAGTFLGLRAVEHGLRTVIVEAGASPQRGGSPEALEPSFRFQNKGPESYPVNGTRAIAVGGASRHWGGVTTRLWPEDFRMKSEFGRLVDWPIGVDDLASYYCEAETLLCTKGYHFVPGAEPARPCPFPDEKDGVYRDPRVRIEGRDVHYFGVPHSRRGGNFAVRLFDEEIPRFVQSPLATLIEDRQVTNIVTLDGKRIDHIELRGLSGRARKLRARNFVVAAGVVESCRLLLASRSSWFPEGIGNRHGQVGHYFNVHPSLQTKFDLRPDLDLPEGHHRTCSLNGAYRREGFNACQFQIDVLGDGSARWKAQPEIEPSYDSYIALSSTDTDDFGVPLPEVNLRYSAQDKRTLERNYATLEAARRELGAPGGEMKEHDRWRAHPAGTCRMGFDETNGVVDRDNKVFGLDNLFVSGACTFPTSGTANPTNTVVAMTLRLADHIRDRA
jgi:choline dehydrogenase-like flavoprotein